MPIKRLSDEQLRKLTPEERIKYLRALEEDQKKEAEEAQRKAQEEIRAAEKLISESEEEIEEEEEEIDRGRVDKKTQETEVSLEERLAKERAASERAPQRAKAPAIGVRRPVLGGDRQRARRAHERRRGTAQPRARAGDP